MSAETTFKAIQGPMDRTLAHDRESLVELMGATLRRQRIPCINGDLPSRFWTSDNRADFNKAAADCGQCPVVTQCREYGIYSGKGEEGVYGGLGKTARARMADESSEGQRP